MTSSGKATVDRLSIDSTDTFLIPTSSHDHYGKRSHAISKAFGRLRTAAISKLPSLKTEPSADDATIF
ncbi:hypothetical protein CDH05_22440 [Pseudomonas lactis]|nr:hypothetical protein CDH05_22440 [Pseudomonas lactis]